MAPDFGPASLAESAPPARPAPIEPAVLAPPDASVWDDEGQVCDDFSDPFTWI
jgi:hypothetical protein